MQLQIKIELWSFLFTDPYIHTKEKEEDTWKKNRFFLTKGGKFA